MSRRAALLIFCLASPASALAHPPYEQLERVVTDSAGRALFVKKSYIDGIFFSDPVKLVVLDADDRTIAETEYGREISVICWRSRPCVVFRYDGLTPVLPQNVWRLTDGKLLRAESHGLTALGVVAPLWTNAGGYLLSVVSLCAFVPIVWVLRRSRPSPVRSALIGATVFVAPMYLGAWLYVVVFLSYVSLPLVIAAGMIGGGAVVLIGHAARRAGIADTTVLRAGRVYAVAVAALGGTAVIWVIWTVASANSRPQDITFEEPAVHAPLATARVTRVKGVPREVFVTVSKGIKLEEVVNLDLFQGFDASMTREEADSRLGPPSGRWTDPALNVQAGYYDQRDGRVSVVRRGGSSWSVIGYPSACTHEYVFRDRRLRDQILQWLPGQETIQVHVLRDVGFAGLTVLLSRDSCTNMILTARDGDPGSP